MVAQVGVMQHKLWLMTHCSPSSTHHRYSDHRALALLTWQASQPQSRPDTAVHLSEPMNCLPSAVLLQGTCRHPEAHLCAV